MNNPDIKPISQLLNKLKNIINTANLSEIFETDTKLKDVIEFLSHAVSSKTKVQSFVLEVL